MRFKRIYIEITNICNLNCSFCSTSNKKKKEITLEEFKIILIKIGGIDSTLEEVNNTMEVLAKIISDYIKES